jgi:hypothetical protein
LPASEFCATALAETPARKVTQAPPWLAWLLTPLIARNVARAMVKQYPDLGADQIIEKMRADVGSDPAGLKLLEAVRARLPREPGGDAAEGGGVTWQSPSSLALVAANLLALWGVAAWGWPVFPVLLLFWLENVVIGVLNVMRMLLVDPGDLALWAGKLFLVPFFCFHYGMFTQIHGAFVLSLFGGKDYAADGISIMPALARAVHDYHLWLPLAALAASHLFSFCWNYMLRGEYQRAELGMLMAQPYLRILVLHVTIIFGGLAAMALGSPLWALLLLLALKIWIDLKAHLRERNRLAQ